MKVFFLFVFLYIFFVDQTYLAFGCEETFRRYAYNDADQLVFLRNFQKENVSGENVRFIVMQGKLTEFVPLSIAEIIDKTDEQRLRVKTSQSIVYDMDYGNRMVRLVSYQVIVSLTGGLNKVTLN